MRPKYKILLIISPLIFILDQFTKHLIITRVAFGERIPVIGGFFDIVHFKNTGAAFGMLSSVGGNNKNYFFYAVAALAVTFIIIYLSRLTKHERYLSVVFALIIGGIFGNIVDRIRLGAVTDFLSFHVGTHEWPAFNVADSAITVAMVLLVIFMLFIERKDASRTR